MKLRKIKLLSSFLSLALVTAILTVGVWASTSQTINVRTTVTFSATGVSGSILGTLTGLDNATYYYNTTMALGGTTINFTPKSTALENWVLGESSALAINSTDGVPDNIVYSFTITNSSTTENMLAKISAVNLGPNLQIVSIQQDTETITDTAGTYVMTDISASQTSTIVATFAVVDASTSISSADISFNLTLTNPNFSD